jgi:hypothetical protein
MSDKHPFHIAKSLEYGWDVLSKRWLALVLWTIILWIPHGMISAASLIFAIFAAEHQAPWYLKVISLGANLITYMLYTRVVLLCMDDDPAGIGDVLSGFKFLIPFSIASLLFFLAFTFGLIALVVPGIYIGLAGSLYSFLVVDQFMGPIEALKRSIYITKGHLLQLAFLYFVLCMVIFGGLICFVVGVIPASIVCTVALADVYRRLDQAYDQVDEGEDGDSGEQSDDDSEPEDQIAG